MAVYNQELNQETANSTQRLHKWRKRLIILLALVLGIVAAYWLRWPTFSWNQKMTVEIEVGGQMVSCSSVSHVKVSHQPQLLPEISSTEKNVQGEAVDVRLPNGRHVFALLASPDNPDYATSIARKLFADVPHDDRSGAWTGLYSVISRLRETRELPANLYPMFVTFDNITDPKTVREVDPANFAATLGPGTAVKRVSLGITDEQQSTEGLAEEVLDWLCPLRELRAQLNGNTGAIFDNELSNNIGSGTFKTEKCS